MRPDNLLKNRDGLSPVIGNVLMILIVILIGAALAVSLLGGENEEKLTPAPLANLRVSEYNNTTLKIDHNGGDVIEFDNSRTSVILNVAEKNYLLNASTLGFFRAGENKLLLLKDREGNSVPKKAGDVATFKVIDLGTQQLIFTQEIRFTEGYEPEIINQSEPAVESEIINQSEPVVEYQSGITGYYYQGVSFSGTAVDRTDSRLKFAENTYASASLYGTDIENWPYGILATTDSFSVVYEGLIKIEQDSSYTFYLTSDDWAQLYIDGNPVITESSSSVRHSKTTNTGTLSLPAGYHQIRVEMKEYAGTSILRLEWASESFSRCFVENFYHEVSSM